jgi:hypothetical protein
MHLNQVAFRRCRLWDQCCKASLSRLQANYRHQQSGLPCFPAETLEQVRVSLTYHGIFKGVSQRGKALLRRRGSVSLKQIDGETKSDINTSASVYQPFRAGTGQRALQLSPRAGFYDCIFPKRLLHSYAQYILF